MVQKLVHVHELFIFECSKMLNSSKPHDDINSTPPSVVARTTPWVNLQQNKNASNGSDEPVFTFNNLIGWFNVGQKKLSDIFLCQMLQQIM